MFTYTIIKQTSKPSNSTIPNPQKRFWRALTTYNNPPHEPRHLSSNAKLTLDNHLCKDVWSCEALLDGEKGIDD